jgi:hypothetical protein
MAIRKLAICSCDLCKQVVPSEEHLKNLALPVKFLTEQTEGRACEPYFINQKFDLCGACLEAVSVVLGEGAQGYNRFWLKGDSSNQQRSGREENRMKSVTVLATIDEKGNIRVHETGEIIGKLDGAELEQLKPFDVFGKSKD